MSDPVANLNFPAEWTHDNPWQPGFPELVKALTYDRLPDERFFIAGGILKDGTNLIGLCWSSGRGQHVMRCGPPLWAVEERTDPKAHPATRKLWRMVVESMAAGRREAERELGRLL